MRYTKELSNLKKQIFTDRQIYKLTKQVKGYEEVIMKVSLKKMQNRLLTVFVSSAENLKSKKKRKIVTLLLVSWK